MVKYAFYVSIIHSDFLLWKKQAIWLESEVIPGRFYFIYIYYSK